MSAERYPDTIFQKIRESILKKSGIFPGVLGRSNESNLRMLTRAKAATVGQTERATKRKVSWQPKIKEGD